LISNPSKISLPILLKGRFLGTILEANRSESEEEERRKMYSCER
jgi:hypothetical protein